MPMYTTDTRVTAHLPTNLPDSLDTAGERAEYLTRGSALAESLVGPRFPLGEYGGATQKFPDADDSPPTPEIISELAALCAAALILGRVGVDNMSGGSAGAELREKAAELAGQIRSGDLDVVDSAGTRYGDRASAIVSTDSGAEPVFSIGRHGEDGECLRPGTLDDR